ncbi:MAG: site-specific integrase [Gemmatimonadetes bacterium]|nr:site-specific integrase [Gemmatimonadota bacterium]
MDLTTLFELYRRYRTPRKSVRERRADERRIDLWTRFLGERKDPMEISLREWESFLDARLSGAIDARGRPVPDDNRVRRPVGHRTVEADLKWLKWVFNWAAKWRTETGYLLAHSPVRGYEIPREKNPRRPVATRERFEATRAVSDDVRMLVPYNGERRTARSHLSELLDRANGTGRRLSAICTLRLEDLRLDQGPHGAILWPADTDKQGRASLIPITRGVRAALDRALRERPPSDSTHLFPSPGDPAKPVSRHLADKWLRKAEQMAGVRPLNGSLWHAYRRKWATERKHLPATDVAAAGGWVGPESMQRCYQHADPETLLRVVLGTEER